jgi:hypothetical protein
LVVDSARKRARTAEWYKSHANIAAISALRRTIAECFVTRLDFLRHPDQLE